MTNLVDKKAYSKEEQIKKMEKKFKKQRRGVL